MKDILNRFHKLKDRIALIEQKAHNPPEELKKLFPNHKLCICDFYVQGAEDGELKPYGIIYEDMMNIDHHAPIEAMSRYVSSGVLASEYLKEHEPLGEDHKILINHADCDSIISAFLMSGILPPDERFAKSVIHADHTGEEDDIGDLLQQIQYKRDLDYIAEQLSNMLSGQPLDDEAQKALAARRKERKQVFENINEGLVKTEGNVSFIISDARADPTLYIPFLPDAKAILIAYKSLVDTTKWNIRIRLGMHAEGIKLNTLDLPDFGGRWNAGSTRRFGGTSIHPEEYAEILDERMRKPRKE